MDNLINLAKQIVNELNAADLTAVESATVLTLANVFMQYQTGLQGRVNQPLETQELSSAQSGLQ